MGLTRIPVGTLEKSSKADMLTRLTTRIIICISRSQAVRNRGERKDNFESISKESFIVVRANTKENWFLFPVFQFIHSFTWYLVVFACY